MKIGDKIAAQSMQCVFQLSPIARDFATATIAAVATLDHAKAAAAMQDTEFTAARALWCA